MLAAAPVAAQVTFDRILNAVREPQNWLTYSGTVLSQRHSPLTQITPENVKNLELQWVWQAFARKVRGHVARGGWRPLYGAGAK